MPDGFLEKGSRKQQKPKAGDELGNDIQWAGLVSSRSLTAEEMLEYKRQHWTVENRLHYVLDETFGEDKSTIKKGKNTMSTLRKCSYNIVRLLQMKDQCILQSPADSDAFQSGRCAKHNGRPETMYF